jgi:putative colanic acid biosynthesis acetyltransferase WcaB
MNNKQGVVGDDVVRNVARITPELISKPLIMETKNDARGPVNGLNLRHIFQDAKANSPKIKCLLVLFRLASFFERKKKSYFYRAFYELTNRVYCLFSDLFVGIELPAGTSVGRNLTIHHGYGIVIGKEACLKDNVVLRQGVTIGNYVDRSGRVRGNPHIESGVEFGAGACALGDITIGEGAFIAANCVVYKNVRAQERVYPARGVSTYPPVKRDKRQSLPIIK